MTILDFMKMNTVEKEEISPLTAVFSKDLHCRHVKTRACLGNG